jgi:hypothetical protein
LERKFDRCPWCRSIDDLVCLLPRKMWSILGVRWMKATEFCTTRKNRETTTVSDIFVPLWTVSWESSVFDVSSGELGQCSKSLRWHMRAISLSELWLLTHCDTPRSRSPPPPQGTKGWWDNSPARMQLKVLRKSKRKWGFTVYQISANVSSSEFTFTFIFYIYGTCLLRSLLLQISANVSSSEFTFTFILWQLLFQFLYQVGHVPYKNWKSGFVPYMTVLVQKLK